LTSLVVEYVLGNSLYIVLHITKRYYKIVFLNTEQHTLAEFNKAELKSSKKKRYLLYYRRFAHLRRTKITKLYEVTGL
jgi:hypothetical protein